MSTQNPLISILVAVRNEEANLDRCLNSLAYLRSHGQSWEVWLGDDQSEDQSGKMIRYFVWDKPHFHLLSITHPRGQARGKANVIAHLANQAQGSLLFMSDADVVLPKDWLHLAEYFEDDPRLGVLAGLVFPRGACLFHHLQSLEWAAMFALLEQAARWQLPITMMGANMVVHKTAYKAVGGYEGMPFSITEDFALFHQIVRQGFRFNIVIRAESTVFTPALSSPRAYLQQRKRWLRGGWQSPWWLKSGIVAYAAYLPLCGGLWWLGAPLPALFGLVVKMGIEALLIYRVLREVRQRWLMIYLPLYQPYILLSTLAVLVFYLLPFKISWKGRTYS
ncbi:MAG: glycosyltransferase [Bacteroidia bacterium]|nr:glycosyltransferase [Bacteroidia bacterium]